MKTLLLLRHAKSSWDNSDLADHDRPLNGRGRRDAPRMGQLLAQHDLTPDLIVTSAARRAATTAEPVSYTHLTLGKGTTFTIRLPVAQI